MPRLLRLWDVFEIWYWLDLKLHSHSGIKLGDLSFVMTDLRGLRKVKEGLNNLWWSQLFKVLERIPFPLTFNLSENHWAWKSDYPSTNLCLHITEHLKHCQYHKPQPISKSWCISSADHLILLTLMNRMIWEMTKPWHYQNKRARSLTWC